MLVLSRRVDESIRIGNDIKITVTKIAGGNVRLGIQAPDEMSILRDELLPIEHGEAAAGFSSPGQPAAA